MKQFDDFMNAKSEMSSNTIRSYNHTISKFLEYYKIQSIDDYNALTLLDFENYFQNLGKKDSEKNFKRYKEAGSKLIKNTTYNTHLRNMRAFSCWLKKHGFSDEDYCLKIPFKREEDFAPISLVEEERMAMIKAAPSLDFKVSLGLMLYMGLREFETLKVRIEDIDFNSQKLNIFGKGGKKVKLQIPPFLMDMITEYLSTRDAQSEYLLLSKVGNHPIKNQGSINKRVKSVAKKAGINTDRIDHISSHTCRRTYACRAVENGTPVQIVKDMMRHSSAVTTQRYLKAMGMEPANKAIANQPVPDWK